MYDNILLNLEKAKKYKSILTSLEVEEKEYCLITLHRPYNVDDPNSLIEILSSFSEIKSKLVFPIHPRTRKIINENNITIPKNIIITEPKGFFEFLALQYYSNKIITDSGGVQKEAYFLKIPCITLRSETEWIETVEVGANILVKERNKINILNAYYTDVPNSAFSNEIYGKGDTANLILDYLK